MDFSRRQGHQRIIDTDAFMLFLVTTTILLWIAAAVLWAFVLS